MSHPPSTASDRRRRADDADRLVADAFTAAVEPDPTGLVAVAVGGYGRRELSPSSDLDVVLLHDPAVPEDRVREVAEALWYPLWDARIPLDHSVRDAVQMRATAAEDHRAAMGMLDARTVAGDAGLVLALRSHVLADWRREARTRVEDLRAGRRQRLERSGWLAYAAVPDLKESGGGLRDGVDLRALVATWLVDVPHAEVEELRSALLDVRDALHTSTGRRTDRLAMEDVPAVAEAVGMEPQALDLHVRHLGRRIAHVADVTWRRLDAVLAPRASPRPRPGLRRTGPAVVQVDAGVGWLGDEVVLTADADPRRDPAVALRAAAVAARAGLPFAAGTAQRLARDLGPLEEPWPAAARRSLVDLLTAGHGLVEVWDELDIAGVVDRWLPEWADVRLRGSSSPVHRFTVDRHSVETCVVASTLRRDVARPDLLAVAALLHDIGKGRPGDHSEVGAPMAEAVALRWGFPPADAAVVGRLVRWHLLLGTVATRRDIEDPATAANVAEIVGDAAFLDLLASLTQADARSTGPTAWTSWRRGLIEGLVAKTHQHLAGTAPATTSDAYEGWPAELPFPSADALARARRGEVRLDVVDHHGGSLVTVVTADRPGVMALIAGGLALQGLAVRSVRVVTQDDAAVSLWEVARPDLLASAVRERLLPVLAGDVPLERRMTLTPVEGLPARVRVLPGLSESATLLEVRAADRRGLVWTVCAAIAAVDCSIRSAHLSTYGDEARDVFYVVDADGEPLDEAATRRLHEAVDAALV
ncbi:[protein-PII] uridylyltransferase [uncultured Aeromicrobium sp.]|uniref:[protein-PII] uridylyltransferase n=2 Tax=Aeromicrobium TaxID=2040 RepID=UPI002593034D|nr:[protein-PII] uridylyltransferase [uncultured Aeromicrobium sp.]